MLVWAHTRRALFAVVALLAAACVVAERPSMPVQQLIDGPTGRLFVDDGGGSARMPVVLIHSLAGNSGQWTPQLAHLRRATRAVALDLRGHGRSEAPTDGRFAPGDYAEDVRLMMDTLGIRRAVLVGHSLGGGVAAALAGLVPDRVAGLVFVDPIDDTSKRPPDEGSAAFLRRLEGPEYAMAIEAYWMEILKLAGDGVRQQVLADLRATPQATVVGSMRAMTGFNAQATLAAYHGPMLSVTTPLNEFPSSLHRVMPVIRQEKMADVSHWLHLDRPAEFNAMLGRFLAAIPD